MDIVERLREAARGPYPVHQPEAMFSALCDQAAAEIDRLRAALWHVREDMAQLVQQVDGVVGSAAEQSAPQKVGPPKGWTPDRSWESGGSAE